MPSPTPTAARRARAQAVAEVVNQKTGFAIPWELIIPLIEWLMEECFNNAESFVNAARSPSDFRMMRLYRQCVRQLRGTYYGRDLRQAANALANEMIEQGLTIPEEQLVELVA